MPIITLSGGGRLTLPEVEILTRGNTSAEGVWRFQGAEAGPHLAITALIHGNEVCGAHALAPLLSAPPPLRRGTLTLAFCNLAAYGALTDDSKSACRLRDEDMNRVWGRLAALPTPGDSYEIRRARALLPWLEGADYLLDIHSMSTVAPALGLVAMADKNIPFARALGAPEILLRDAGHAAGLRLIDSGGFARPDSPQACMLVECGEHFAQAAMDTAVDVVARALRLLDAPLAEVAAQPTSQRVIEVTQAVTIRTGAFRWLQDWPNMSCVPEAGTLVGMDGDEEVRTPHEHAYMVMPVTERFRKPGQTAVRFGRLRTL